MDVSAQATMKGAAKCDNLCELQNSVNQQSFERVLCFWDIPESMPALVSIGSNSGGNYKLSCLCATCVHACVRVCHTLLPCEVDVKLWWSTACGALC